MRQSFLHTAKIPLFIRVVSLYVVLSAPIMLLHTAAYAKPPVTEAVYESAEPAHEEPTVDQKPVIRGTPKRLIVSRLGIDLPVIAGNYDAEADNWTLSEDSAHFATMTTAPNDQNGLTLIYGHNTWAVFAPLISLQPGDTVRLRTTGGHTFVYTFKESTNVTPTTTSILSRKAKKPQLALMTCDGIWNESRRIMYFDLKKVSSAAN